jgi:3-keto-disaccharide hydrolase
MTMRPRRHLVVPITASVFCVAALAACATSGSGSSDTGAGATPAPTTTASASGTPAANTLTPAEQAAGWRLLFDGQSTTGWRGYKTQTMPNGWRVEDGTLTKTGSVDDIVTADQFANFELALDWKIATGGNAGIFYRGTEEYEKIYWSAPEYQLLDDADAPDGKNRLTSAAAAYALYPPPAGIVKPAGEWNSTRLVVNGAHVEHWLNGQKVVQYELWSPDWEAKVKASKFNDWPNYGRAKSGYIAIQGDHNGVLALRNIRIRTLP